MSKLFDGDELVVFAPEEKAEAPVEVPASVQETVDPIVTKSEESDEFNVQRFAEIHELINRDLDQAPKSVYFKSTGVGRSTYSLDNSCFMPSVMCCIGGSFEKKYQQQLKDILTEKGMTQSNMMGVIVLYRSISLGHVPILIKSKKYSKLLPVICKALNTFFYEYRVTIRSMYTMFNSNVTTKTEENLVNQKRSIEDGGVKT